MTRRIATLAMLLLTVGCSGVAIEPCPMDTAQEDGGTVDAGRPLRVWGPNQTCVLVPARLAECGLNCPFIDGGTCDPEQTLFCLWLLETRGDDCPSVASIVRSPDCADACLSP